MAEEQYRWDPAWYCHSDNEVRSPDASHLAVSRQVMRGVRSWQPAPGTGLFRLSTVGSWEQITAVRHPVCVRMPSSIQVSAHDWQEHSLLSVVTTHNVLSPQRLPNALWGRGWCGVGERSTDSPLLGTTYPEVLSTQWKHWAGLKANGLLGGQRLFRWSPLLPGGVYPVLSTSAILQGIEDRHLSLKWTLPMLNHTCYLENILKNCMGQQRGPLACHAATTCLRSPPRHALMTTEERPVCLWHKLELRLWCMRKKTWGKTLVGKVSAGPRPPLRPQETFLCGFLSWNQWFCNPLPTAVCCECLEGSDVSSLVLSRP